VKVNKVISYAGGWKALNEKSDVMEDISKSLSGINIDTLKSIWKDWEREFNRDESDGRMPIHISALIRYWDASLQGQGWESIRIMPGIPGGIRIFVRNFKKGVSSKIILQDRMLTFPNWVLIEAPRMISTGFCDVAVLMVPMSSIEESFKFYPRLMGAFTFEKAFSQLNELLPLSQKQPFVIIGFSDKAVDVEVTEILPRDAENVIERVLEFPTEHYQAGVAILSYFGEILKQKYPDIEAKVRIEQDGNIVRMTVDTDGGSREIIEKTLEDYALVVTNKSPPESLLSDVLQIHALNNKLSLAELEIKQTRDLLRITEGHYASKINALSEEVGFLRGQMNQQMQFLGTSQRMLANQSEKEERLLMAHIESARRNIEDMVQDAWDSAELRNALLTIKLSLENAGECVNEHEVVEALTTVRDVSPSTFWDLSELLRNTIYGVAGNTVFNFLQQVSRTIC